MFCYFISRRKWCHLSKLRNVDQKDAIGEVENMPSQQHIIVINWSSKNSCHIIKKRLWEKVTRKYSYIKTNKMHLLSQIRPIYSSKTLYMFRAVFPFIIRSSKLRIQQRYMSNSCCYSLMFLYWYVSFACLALINLIFIGSCIVIYSYSTINKMHLLSHIIYSCKTLYMFRSFRLSSGAQKCVYSNGICQTAAATAAAVWHIPLLYTQFWAPDFGRKDLAHAVAAAVWHIPLLYTQFWAPDDGRKDRPKYVDRFTRINNLR